MVYCLLFLCLLLLIWGHFSELSFPGFHTPKRRARHHSLFRSAPSEKRKIPPQNDRAATNPTQNPSTNVPAPGVQNKNCVFNGHVSWWMCTQAFTLLRSGIIETKLPLGVSCRARIALLFISNETGTFVLGFCVGFVAARSFWAGIFCFSEGALRNGLWCLALLLGVWNPGNDNSLKWPQISKRRQKNNKQYTV